MIEIAPEGAVVNAPMTMPGARQLLDAGGAVLRQGIHVFDFSAVTEADSSAVAVMLGWVRIADSQGARLEFRQVPAGVRSLAELYGVHDLLPIL